MVFGGEQKDDSHESHRDEYTNSCVSDILHLLLPLPSASLFIYHLALRSLYISRLSTKI